MSYFLSGLGPDLFVFLDYLLCNLLMEVRWKYTVKSFVHIKYLLQARSSNLCLVQLTRSKRARAERITSGWLNQMFAVAPGTGENHVMDLQTACFGTSGEIW